MSLLRRIFGALPTRVDDPVLGVLTRTDSGWSGQATWPHGENAFALSVHRVDQVPQPSDRLTFEHLSRDYRSLCADIQLCVFSLWNDYRANTGAGAPEFASSLSLWSLMQLQGVCLYNDGRAELIYGFCSDEQPEGAFFVGVNGQRVEPVEYVE